MARPTKQDVADAAETARDQAARRILLTTAREAGASLRPGSDYSPRPRDPVSRAIRSLVSNRLDASPGPERAAWLAIADILDGVATIEGDTAHREYARERCAERVAGAILRLGAAYPGAERRVAEFHARHAARLADEAKGGAS